MQILHIGAGEGGTNIVNLLKKTYPDSICKTINTSENDHLKAKNLEEADKLLLKETRGLAKKMKEANEIIRNQGMSIVEKLIMPELEKGVTRIIIHATTGGGTGIGIATALSNSFKENLGDSVKFAVSLVAPFEYDDMTSFKNTVLSIKVLEEMGVPTRIVSNANFLNREGSSEADIHDKVNKYIISSLMDIVSAPSKPTLGRNTDYEEIDEVLFRPGYTFVFKTQLSNKHKDRNLQSIVNAAKTSLDLGFNPGDYIFNRLIILSANATLASEINIKDINDQLGIVNNSSFYTHLEPEQNQEYLLIVLSGCNLPDKIKKMEDSVKVVQDKAPKKTFMSVDSSIFREEKNESAEKSDLFDSFFKKNEEKDDIIKNAEKEKMKSIVTKWKF